MTARDLLRIESPNTLWLFDQDDKRFLRIARSADPTDPSFAERWERYSELEIDLETGAFTVVLNDDRTRLLRSFRDDAGHSFPGSERPAS